MPEVHVLARNWGQYAAERRCASSGQLYPQHSEDTRMSWLETPFPTDKITMQRTQDHA